MAKSKKAKPAIIDCGNMDGLSLSLSKAEKKRLITAALNGEEVVLDDHGTKFGHVAVVVPPVTRRVRPHTVVWEYCINGKMMFIFLDTPPGVVEGAVGHCGDGVRKVVPAKLGNDDWRLVFLEGTYALYEPVGFPYATFGDGSGDMFGYYPLTEREAKTLGWPVWKMELTPPLS